MARLFTNYFPYFSAQSARLFIINILPDLIRCYYVWMNKEKIIIISLLVLSSLGIYYSTDWNSNSIAGIWTTGEKEFSKPIDVVWRGEIISTMAGGSCIGMNGEFDNYRWAAACLSNTNSNELWKI